MTDGPPPAGLVMVRGLGYGALLGLFGGYLLFPLTQAFQFSSWRDIGLGFVLGFLAAPFGVLYGSVAGVVVGLAFLPFRAAPRAERAARIVAAVVGPLVVAGLSWAMFRPSFRVGGNETMSHVVERVLLFFAIPGGCALLAGALFGGRLAQSIEPLAGIPGHDESPSSSR